MHQVKKKQPPSQETPWHDYDVTIGVRIRLTDDQKSLIKQRFDEIAAGMVSNETVSTRGGLSVRSATAPAQLILDLGMDRCTLSAVLAGNERHTVQMLKKFERVVEIELLSKKQLDDAWKSYRAHIGV